MELKEDHARFVDRKLLFMLIFILRIVVLAGVAATLGLADTSIFEVYSAILARTQ